MGNIMEKAIKKQHPNYDPDRHYWEMGDTVSLPNQAKIIVLSDTFEEVEGIVIKTGFGMKKGTIVKIQQEELPVVSKKEYSKEEYTPKSDKIMKWEVGDVIKDDDNIVVLYNIIDVRSHSYFQAMMLEPSEKIKDHCGFGTRIAITDPYASLK